MKQYYVAATDKGVHFHKMSFLGKPLKTDFLTYDEIKKIDAGKGFITRKLKFTFGNGRKLSIDACLKGNKKIPKLDDKLLSYMQEKVGNKA